MDTMGSLCIILEDILSQGVVTYMSCVEEFVAVSKLNQAIKALLGGQSRDQGDLQTAKINNQELAAAT